MFQLSYCYVTRYGGNSHSIWILLHLELLLFPTLKLNLAVKKDLG